MEANTRILNETAQDGSGLGYTWLGDNRVRYRGWQRGGSNTELVNGKSVTRWDEQVYRDYTMDFSNVDHQTLCMALAGKVTTLPKVEDDLPAIVDVAEMLRPKERAAATSAVKTEALKMKDVRETTLAMRARGCSPAEILEAVVEILNG